MNISLLSSTFTKSFKGTSEIKEDWISSKFLIIVVVNEYISFELSVVLINLETLKDTFVSSYPLVK